MLPFRKNHILKILNNYSLDQGPLDLFLSQYFRCHHSLGSKDRKYIATTIYTLYKQLGLIDAIAKRPLTWDNRIEALENIETAPTVLPSHVRVSFPKDLFTLLANAYGEEHAMHVCSVLNEKAPVTLRVNTLKTSREALINQLSPSYPLKPCTHSSLGVTLKERSHLMSSSAFRNGLFEMQDEASQLAALFADPKPSEHILDFCSGAGGKSLAMACLMSNYGQLYLHDIRENALFQARKRMQRAGVQNFQLVKPHSKQLARLKAHMDCVFVDVPCSGTGTLRRHPEQKWRFTLKYLQELIQIQREIVKQAIEYLKPKGRLVYATCSILEEENQKQLEYFRHHYRLQVVKEPLCLSPQSDGMDGFFAAVLQKQPT